VLLLLLLLLSHLLLLLLLLLGAHNTRQTWSGALPCGHSYPRLTGRACRCCGTRCRSGTTHTWCVRARFL
jgi:hypothetical protein